jgi:hypothetical protein
MQQMRLLKNTWPITTSDLPKPHDDFNAHRPLALTDDLDAEFTWREPGGFQNLTVQYDKVLYLIEDSEYSRRAIGKYIDVWHYPDGHKELRLNDVLLPIPPMTGCRKLTPSRLLIIKDWAMCWTLPAGQKKG